MTDILEMLKRHEGFKQFPYLCTAGKLTVGYGRNLDDVGLSEYEAEFLLLQDIKHATKRLTTIFPNFYDFTVNRQAALIDLMVNIGSRKFLLFRKMIIAIKNNDWQEAAEQLKDSKYYNQVPNRAEELKELLRSEE